MKKILHIQVLPKLSGVQNISYEILKGLPSDDLHRVHDSNNSYLGKKSNNSLFQKINWRLIAFINIIKRYDYILDIFKTK